MRERILKTSGVPPQAQRTTRLLVLAAMGLALAGCAPSASRNGTAWRIEPVMRVESAQSDARRAEFLYRLGRFQEEQGRGALAEQTYRRTIGVDAGHVEARNALGVMLARQGRLEEAIFLLEGAAALAPGSSHIHSNLGYAYLLAQRHADAVRALDVAVHADAGNARARANLALAVQRGIAADTNRPAELATPAAEVAVKVSVGDVTAPAPEGAPPLAMAEPAVAGPSASGVVAIGGLAQGRLASSSPEEGLRLTLSETLVRPAPAVLPAAARPYRLEIANAMGVVRAARRVNAALTREGVPQAFLTDQRPFTQQRTEVQFVRSREAEARQLAERLGGQAVSAEAVLRSRGVQVRIVLGKDVAPLLASLGGPGDRLCAGSARIPVC